LTYEGRLQNTLCCINVARHLSLDVLTASRNRDCFAGRPYKGFLVQTKICTNSVLKPKFIQTSVFEPNKYEMALMPSEIRTLWQAAIHGVPAPVAGRADLHALRPRQHQIWTLCQLILSRFKGGPVAISVETLPCPFGIA